MGLISRRDFHREPADRLTRLIAAALTLGMLAAVAASLWTGLRALPAL
jgi:hypothetical protein